MINPVPAKTAKPILKPQFPKCVRCGGQVLKNYDEFRCLQCGAEHTKQGRLIEPHRFLGNLRETSRR